MQDKYIYIAFGWKAYFYCVILRFLNFPRGGGIRTLVPKIRTWLIWIFYFLNKKKQKHVK